MRFIFFAVNIRYTAHPDVFSYSAQTYKPVEWAKSLEVKICKHLNGFRTVAENP
jgi:hypothetical protein